MDNAIAQIALVISPTILSFIYQRSPSGAFIFSAVLTLSGLAVMIILCCREDGKVIGKTTSINPTKSKQTFV